MLLFLPCLCDNIQRTRCPCWCFILDTAAVVCCIRYPGTFPTKEDVKRPHVRIQQAASREGSHPVCLHHFYLVTRSGRSFALSFETRGESGGFALLSFRLQGGNIPQSPTSCLSSEPDLPCLQSAGVLAQSCCTVRCTLSCLVRSMVNGNIRIEDVFEIIYKRYLYFRPYW